MNNFKAIQDAIINAISTLIDGKLKKLKFNYYVDGVIVKNDGLDGRYSPTYTVNINGFEYKNIPSQCDAGHNNGDKVQIIVQNGDWNKKIIDNKQSFALPTYWFSDEAECDKVLQQIYEGMKNNSMRTICIVGNVGHSVLGGGNNQITLHKTTNACGAMTAIKYTGRGLTHQWTRELLNGVWQDWCWVNPPMNVGYEYRTAEQYMGKSVYTKIVDCGNLPNTTSKNVACGVDASKVIHYDVIAHNASTGITEHAPMFSGTTLGIQMRACIYGTNINLYSNCDLSGYTAKCILKYVK